MKNLALFTSLFLFEWMKPVPAQATLERWPRDHRATEKVFSPNRPSSFADTLGLIHSGATPPDRSTYAFFSPTYWPSNTKCGEPTRGQGHLHSDFIVTEEEKLVRVSFPIQFKFQSDFIKTRKKEYLAKTLLKVSLLRMNPNTLNLDTMDEPDLYTLKSLYALANSYNTNDDEPLVFELNRILIGKPYLVPTGSNIRVRVEWSANGICDEIDSKFELGDQIRLLTDS